MRFCFDPQPPLGDFDSHLFERRAFGAVGIYEEEGTQPRLVSDGPVEPDILVVFFKNIDDRRAPNDANYAYSIRKNGVISEEGLQVLEDVSEFVRLRLRTDANDLGNAYKAFLEWCVDRRMEDISLPPN